MERKEKNFRSITFVLFIIFFIWILLQFLAPIMLPKGSVDDFSGFAGSIDNKDFMDNMSFPWNYIYLSGDIFCHQKVERSFILNENSMPFCARCTAIFVGIVIGLGIMLLYTINLDRNFLVIVVFSLIPIGIDGIMQLFGFWESTNIIRVITGLLVGIVCGLSVGVIVDEVQIIRREKIKK
ncbi:MAG: DUF2085 domain-containing protein [Thermoplasmatota archaeon]